MPEFATVKASDLAKYGRIDATFHIARVKVEALTRHLEEEHTADEAVALLEGLDLDALRAVQPLVRGTRKVDSESAMKAVREYPHIALALVQSSIHETIAAKQAEIERSAAGMERLRSLLPK